METQTCKWEQEKGWNRKRVAPANCLHLGMIRGWCGFTLTHLNKQLGSDDLSSVIIKTPWLMLNICHWRENQETMSSSSESSSYLRSAEACAPNCRNIKKQVYFTFKMLQYVKWGLQTVMTALHIYNSIMYCKIINVTYICDLTFQGPSWWSHVDKAEANSGVW